MTPTALAQQMMLTLHNDLPRLIRIDDYLQGDHDDPYEPDSAGAEYRKLAKRSITNILPLTVAASCESLYVDSVRPGRQVDDDPSVTLPEWKHWQRSRMDAKQIPVHREAISYGHSFTATVIDPRSGKSLTKGLGALNTTALFEDPANDETPVAALTVIDWPGAFNGSTGTAIMWDDTNEYQILFTALDATDSIVVEDLGPHGSEVCPVTRFAAYIDLSGRTWGVVEPMMVLQDRINQTVFDLLVAQSGGAFNVRTATGMAPPYKMTYEVDAITGEKTLVPELDSEGQPIIANIPINAMKMLWAEDPETKFGSLPATPLDGYLQAVKAAFEAFAALSQTPALFVLGSIANLTAEALQSSMTALERRVGGFKNVFGEAWERVFRLAAALEGVAEALDDYETECIWRDTNARAFAVVADGLQKLRAAGAPLEGILDMIPGMTSNMKAKWLELIEDEKEEQKEADAAAVQAASIVRNRNATSTTPAAKPKPKAQ